MTEYFKKFTMDKDEVTVIDFGENEVFECKYSDEAKSLCNRLNDLDYEKYNLKKENEELKEILHEVEHELISITGLSAFDKCASHLGYVEVFDKDMIELDYSKLLKRIEKVIE